VSRAEARTLISEGEIRVDGVIVGKPARQVHPGQAIVVVGKQKYVGRGAYKLLGALDGFAYDPSEDRCLDVGASTGGFTDVLLQAGASHVVALDVGHGQLHERIRADERVTVIEHTNMRHVKAGDLGDPFDLVVVDASFISLRTLMPSMCEQLGADGILMALIKPQFEVGRKAASQGKGVISDVELWRTSIDGVIDAAEAEGLRLVALLASPITGGDGNVEYLGKFARIASSEPVINRTGAVNVVISEATPEEQ
jgi:23S rRNA (cytidine1920-2'-O)/16S rRNA (cytidine1409-2'-O)-methyltransferase